MVTLLNEIKTYNLSIVPQGTISKIMVGKERKSFLY